MGVGQKTEVLAMKEETYYRYHDLSFGVFLETFTAVRRTPKCVYVADRFGNEHLVRLYAHKRFAHASKKEAWASFVHRKRWQKKHIERHLEHVKRVLQHIEEVGDAGYFEPDFEVLSFAAL